MFQFNLYAHKFVKNVKHIYTLSHKRDAIIIVHF